MSTKTTVDVSSVGMDASLPWKPSLVPLVRATPLPRHWRVSTRNRRGESSIRGNPGKPWQCLLAAFVGDVEMLVSEETLDEFQRVLEYKHLPFSPEEQKQLPALIEAEATVVGIMVQAVDDDPDDKKFLERVGPNEPSKSGSRRDA